MNRVKVNNVLYISTFPPRECGIATFTRDLSTAFDKLFNPVTKSIVAALNDNPMSFYNYPSKVWNSLSANRLEEYVHLAEKINRNPKIKVVNVQHEFGIFGGDWGDYLIPLLQALKKPAIVTFHSVLSSPDKHLKRTVQLIASNVAAIVVMNERSKNILKTDYNVPKSKIHLIPHGIPSTIFESSREIKKKLGLQNKTVLSTFGMISRDKGIEYAIRALPRVVKRFPNVVYLVIGATHPVVRRGEGEEYRNFLLQEVERLGLKQHVRFYNKYLSLDEIINYLKATDLYIYPVTNPKQSVSGSLSYALGCGRAAVVTPTEYSKHMVKNEVNGLFVKFKNPSSIARAILRILDDEKWLKSMHIEAYESTRYMTWPNVARQYFKLYRKFAAFQSEENKLPKLKLDHLIRLTDDFGVLHHARYSRPEKRFGYSLDDNARALIVVQKYYSHTSDQKALLLIDRYLNFIKFTQRPSGRFTSIINSKRLKEPGTSEDVLGRAIGALGYALSDKNLPKDVQKKAKQIFCKALKALNTINSPRAIAFAMIGFYHYVKTHPTKRYLSIFKRLANNQLKYYKKTASYDWQWFEDRLTYSNSKLPESLYLAYDLLGGKKYLGAAEASLGFLTRITFEPNHYSPIGQTGWYLRGKRRSYFDQQPEDVASMVETKITAYKITGNKEHLEDAYKAFRWFLGYNHLNQTVYDEITGGCHDGLGKTAMNLNQGAESTISYLLARLAFEELNNTQIL